MSGYAGPGNLSITGARASLLPCWRRRSIKRAPPVVFSRTKPTEGGFIRARSTRLLTAPRSCWLPAAPMSEAEPLLVVEDDALTARSLLRLLRLGGYEVRFATSCAEALNVDRRFRAAILDVDLPDGNGVALAAELCSREVVEAVVFFTACTDAASLRRAAALGEVVAKGASGPELLSAVRQARPPQTAKPPETTLRNASGETT